MKNAYSYKARAKSSASFTIRWLNFFGKSEVIRQLFFSYHKCATYTVLSIHKCHPQMSKEEDLSRNWKIKLPTLSSQTKSCCSSHILLQTSLIWENLFSGNGIKFVSCKQTLRQREDDVHFVNMVELIMNYNARYKRV